jgi:hypothetical protein
MNAYEFYCEYQAIKLHFNSSYNYLTYNGKTKTTRESFDKRKDKYFFHKLARKYKDEEVVSFLVANFVHSNDTWTKNLLEEESGDVYRNWKKVTESMSESFKNDVINLLPDKSPNTFNNLFLVQEGSHPALLTAFLQKDVTIETMVILNKMLGFLDKWDKCIDDDILYPKISMKIRKYSDFLSVNVPKYKLIIKSLLSEQNTI